jgi:hypothetical protein
MELDNEMESTFIIWNKNNTIIKITDFDGNHMSGRITDISDRYLKIVFRDGSCAYIAKTNIKFIAPVKRQPQVVI